MGKYILKSNYALRSYSDLQNILIEKFQGSFSILKKSEMEFLKKCDGLTEIPDDNELFKTVLVKKIVQKSNGETLSDWQKNIYHDNAYFEKIELRITDKCNFNCLHCYNAADLSRNNAEWNYEDLLKFLDDLKECGVEAVVLSGGEPMLHPDFRKIVKAIYDRDLYIQEIVTNAYFVDEEILDYIASFGNKPLLKISFDGFGFHDWIRNQKGAQENVLNALNLIKKKDFPILINAQINKKNMESYKETIDYFDDFGLNTLRFIRTTETPRWNLNSGGASLSVKEYFDLMVEILKYINQKDRDFRLILWQFGIFYCASKEYVLCHTSAPSDNKSLNVYACPTTSRQICVSGNGNIYPCSQQSGFFDSQGKFLGNVKETKLKDLLQDSEYLRLAKMKIGEIKDNNSKCAECNVFHQCRGGCRGLANLHTQSFYGCDEMMCMLRDDNYIDKVGEALPEWKNMYPTEDKMKDMC